MKHGGPYVIKLMNDSRITNCWKILKNVFHTPLEVSTVMPLQKMLYGRDTIVVIVSVIVIVVFPYTALICKNCNNDVVSF